jgi:hypothetical protein
MKQNFGFLILAASLPAFANIQFTCDTSSFGTFAPAGTCAALNGSSVSGVYSSIFSNVNASIYISFGATGVAQSSANFTPVSYATYYNALASQTDNPGALASLGGSTDPLGSASNNEVDLSAALASALGITENNADTAGVRSDGITPCTLSVSDPACYSGVITVTNALLDGITPSFFYPPDSPTDTRQIDFYMAVEHETDEILGTVSCIGGSNVDQCNPGNTDASPADLFRYSGTNTRSFLPTSNSCDINGFPELFAYFSIDRGATDIADYNNCPAGGDYGDWISIYPYLVQDGEASPDVIRDISTDIGTNANHYPRPEVAVLDAVGFNLATAAAPEPATLGLIGASLGMLVLARARRR